MIGDPGPDPLRYLPVVELARRSLHGFEIVTASPIAAGLEASIRTAAGWGAATAQGPTVMVDVASDELTADTAELIAALLDAYQVRAETLIVRVPTYDPTGSTSVLDHLVDRGVLVAVRDPDLRGAELGVLAGAPIDLIELPAELVDRLDHDASALHRLTQRIALAHGHDWLTMARGLERLAQIEALERLGCDLASGPAVGPLLERGDADRVVARRFLL